MSQAALKRCRQCKLNSSSDSSPVVRFLEFPCHFFGSCLCKFICPCVRWLLQPNQTENTRARKKRVTGVFCANLCCSEGEGCLCRAKGKYVECAHTRNAITMPQTACHIAHAACRTWRIQFKRHRVALRFNEYSKGGYKLRLVRWGESIQIAFEWPRELLANLIYEH